MKRINKLFYLVLSVMIAIVNCTVLFTVPTMAAAVTPEANNIYYIKNVNSGLYLQVENDSTANGANVCQASGTGSNGQKWIINDNGDGTVRLKSALDLTGGIALDVPNGVADNLTNISTWASNGLAPQNFKLVSNGDGSYAICTQVSDFARCLDVLNWSTESGANVCQYDCFMAANQLWYFEQASWPSSSSSSSDKEETTTKKETTTETTTKATSSSSSSSSSKSWNFSNSSFKNLGTISSTTTVDSLGLIATSSKTMSVKSASATVDGNSYSYCLALGGSGSTSYRAVKVNLTGSSSTIKVTAVSSGSSARTLAVADKNGNQLGTITAGTSAAVGSLTTSYTGDVYIYSTGSGINIYKVQVDSKGGSTVTEATTQATTKQTTTKTQTTTKKETTTQTTTASTSSSSKSWNFSNSNFKSLGTISSSTTVDSLGLIATSSKTMSVNSSSATVDGTTYNYCLALGGSGSTSYRAVKLNLTGSSSTIKVIAKSSGSDARTLVVADSSGKQIGTITAGTTAALGSVTTSKTGTVYIYSAGSGINIYKIQLDSKGGSSSVTEATTQATTKQTTIKTQTTTKKETTTQATTTNTNSGNSKTVTNFSDLASAVKSLASTSGGGTVYVNAKKISCTAQLALNSTKGNPVAIVGVKQSDGTYPVLDFSSFRSSMVGSSAGSLKASSDSGVGVRISGSKYTLKNLIIEKAPDNGIQIKGSNAKNNTVYNCITRYNNDAGLQITGGASNNAIKFVYSYRNCDVYTLGGNSDGFAPKLGATTGNTFYGCYAWDNSDDAWDSYDKTDSGYTYDLSYEECACWNNGNPDVFTGAYDFEQGNALDTDLFLVELICKQDSSFASNYSKGKFSLPTASFVNTEDGKLTLAKWTGSNYGGNDNGFKFGSVNSGSDCVRTVKNCLAFNHGTKGFDNNNSSCTGYFENCVSFDNKYNYYMPPFKIKKWSNIIGFDGASGDKLPSGYSASAPSNESTIRSKVNSTAKSIMDKCNKDIIPGEVYFDIY